MKYCIAEDSPVKHASVDKIEVHVGDDPVSLTKDQVARLASAGVVVNPVDNEGAKA